MNILIAIFSNPAWMVPPAEIERLRRLFPHVTFVNAASREAEAEGILSADAALMSQLRPGQLVRATRLRWIHSPAAGVAGLLSRELRASQVVLTNSRGVHGPAMAEHVIGVTLALLRKLPHAVRQQSAHAWAQADFMQVRLLHGRHMVIVGLGGVGAAIAPAAAALGVRVSGVRRRLNLPPPAGVDRVFGLPQLPELLPEADILVLAAPLTDGTRQLIGARELRLMKPGALLVNVARGKLIQEEELAKELAAGTIGGAALDVFEHEPLDPASPLWDLPNALITPHTAGFFGGYWTATVDLFAENIGRFERGEPLRNIVDKNAGY